MCFFSTVHCTNISSFILKIWKCNFILKNTRAASKPECSHMAAKYLKLHWEKQKAFYCLLQSTQHSAFAGSECPGFSLPVFGHCDEHHSKWKDDHQRGSTEGHLKSLFSQMKKEACIIRVIIALYLMQRTLWCLFSLFWWECGCDFTPFPESNWPPCRHSTCEPVLLIFPYSQKCKDKFNYSQSACNPGSLWWMALHRRWWSSSSWVCMIYIKSICWENYIFLTC